ncbi:putative ester cyclase [Granulicella aggregans]|uniref:Putative ester cyclase n=1 Tax=Granulicella aggregans TaxID=474949 RepID=A0A7W8E4N4_9BACT|nr:ester cyclase [Granulicella aggregans]MBB5057335.1 putative ester cyclase [Granulicella aggregans]
MSTATLTSKQVVEDYFKAFSGKPKTAALIDQWVDDPALKQHILDTEASFPNYELVIHQIVSEGDLVAINATLEAAHHGTFAGIPPTGKHVSVGAMVFYQVSNGRIAKFWMQVDMMGGLAQLKA